MDQTRWNVVSTLLLLVKCPVPIPLKADLIYCVAVITKDNKMAKEMWNILEGIGLLASTRNNSIERNRGIYIKNIFLTDVITKFLLFIE